MKCELLAPAGDLERLNIAYLYGADAVYIGGRDFSLRANAKNFSIDDIKQAVKIAHSNNKKLYVTTNIIFHDKDILGLDEYLIMLDNLKVDAIICSDPTVIKHVKDLNLKIPIHLSTQASTLNHKAALFWKNQGVERIVLAREASRADIIKIKDYTNLELECFIHGAMCTSFSGRCVLSNYATLRDSNRGGCAQICRWVFNINNQSQNFTMMPKDLNMIPFIKDMMDIGVTSFKVEGRMRSIYYIATVIYYYKKLINKINNNTITDAYTRYILHILNRCANRESTPQFYDKLPKKEEQYFGDREELSNQDFLGIVKSYDREKKLVTIEQRNYFKVGDVVEFFGPNQEEYTYKIEKIYDEFMESIEIARHPQMIIKLPINIELNPNDMMRFKIFDISNYL